MNRRKLDQDLSEIQGLISTMGITVLKAFAGSIYSLISSDLDIANRVIDHDEEINQMEQRIMDLGTILIITQQPVAKDLRQIISAFKISSNLERIADLAKDIAKVTLRMEHLQLISPVDYLYQMYEIALRMFEDSIQTYIKEDEVKTKDFMQSNELIDYLYEIVKQEIEILIQTKPGHSAQGSLLLMVAHYIYRIGKHSSNIQQETLYLVNGKLDFQRNTFS